MLHYKIVYSDLKNKPISHLPVYWSTNFRSFSRALNQARKLHKQNRDIVIIEQGSRFSKTWEIKHDEDSNKRFVLCGI